MPFIAHSYRLDLPDEVKACPGNEYGNARNFQVETDVLNEACITLRTLTHDGYGHNTVGSEPIEFTPDELVKFATHLTNLAIEAETRKGRRQQAQARQEARDILDSF